MLEVLTTLYKDPRNDGFDEKVFLFLIVVNFSNVMYCFFCFTIINSRRRCCWSILDLCICPKVGSSIPFTDHANSHGRGIDSSLSRAWSAGTASVPWDPFWVCVSQATNPSLEKDLDPSGLDTVGDS